jgi:hypothetical protein
MEKWWRNFFRNAPNLYNDANDGTVVWQLYISKNQNLS